MSNLIELLSTNRKKKKKKIRNLGIFIHKSIRGKKQTDVYFRSKHIPFV